MIDALRRAARRRERRRGRRPRRATEFAERAVDRLARGRPRRSLLRPLRRAPRRRPLRLRRDLGRRLGRRRRSRATPPTSVRRRRPRTRRRGPRLGLLEPRPRCARCRSWPAPGGGRSAARWSGSPARPARPRSRTSPGRCCRANVHASPENFNTEIGMPLALLAAPRETEVLVMEMAMRGLGQIAELCEIAEPDVAAITNVGPVHLELLGTLEAIVEAKAEILDGLGSAPARAGRSSRPTPRRSSRTCTTRCSPSPSAPAATSSPRAPTAASEPHAGADRDPARRGRLRVPLHRGAQPAQRALRDRDRRRARPRSGGDGGERTSRIEFSRLRGERIALRERILLLNDCYNANPISMRAALEHLATEPGPAAAAASRSSAAWPSSAPTAPTSTRRSPSSARGLGIAPLIGVGELARDYSPDEWVETPAEAAEHGRRRCCRTAMSP